MNLEHQIPELRKLYELRREALKMLDEAERYEVPPPFFDDTEIRPIDKPIIAAFCLKAHKKLREKPALVNIAKMVELDSLFPGPAARDAATVPILIACRVMQALVATSEHAFSKQSMICYYRIIRELFSLRPPDWSHGNARAGSIGRPTAFMTGECLRAITGFADALERTARFIERTKDFKDLVATLELANDHEELEAWVKYESKRLGISWFISDRKQSGARCLFFERVIEPTEFDFEFLRTQIEETTSGLLGKLESARGIFEAARNLAAGRWKAADYSRPRRHFEEAAHLTALDILEEAKGTAENAISAYENGSDLVSLAAVLKSAAVRTRRLTLPAVTYLERVIDRELASVKSSRHIDVPELIFAAASYGAMTGDWKQERLAQVGKLLEKHISEDGEFAAGHPYASTDIGYRMNPVSFEVSRAAAQIFTHVGLPLGSKVPRRMLRLFKRFHIKASAPPETLSGWTFEDAPRVSRPSEWATARASISLQQFAGMLDRLIELNVHEHFQRPPNAESLNLNMLLYPDHAFFCHSGKEKKEYENLYPKHFLGIAFQKLRAHLEGVELANLSAQDGESEFFSSLLSGPPGTGKTTLFEALASTCKVPIVYVSPSDVAIGGEVEVERRTRAIFEALSMLRRTVIVLDEFEPVVARRDPDSEPEGIFRFLTPAMLPKLNKLHRQAKVNQSVYGLITNHFDKLDAAAIRPGRLDHHIDVLHSDRLSRLGFLFARQAASLQEEDTQCSMPELERCKEIAERCRFWSAGDFAKATNRDDVRKYVSLRSEEPPQDLEESAKARDRYPASFSGDTKEYLRHYRCNEETSFGSPLNIDLFIEGVEEPKEGNPEELLQRFASTLSKEGIEAVSQLAGYLRELEAGD
ncbi:MAG: ATP-binding protein [Hyphomicrobiaceae bacterium]|nr:ATP-binding protein [Hyphomicrobiaceae bacterium]